MLAGRFEIVQHFNPKLEPAAAQELHLEHDVYLARRV
jgi:hypothetical protein